MQFRKINNNKYNSTDLNWRIVKSGQDWEVQRNFNGNWTTVGISGGTITWAKGLANSLIEERENAL
jgi:hypothetical protein